MRLHRLDAAAWQRIARDLNKLCDELVADDGDDYALPYDRAATRCFEQLTSAAIFATFCSVCPDVSLSALRRGLELQLQEPIPEEES